MEKVYVLTARLKAVQRYCEEKTAEGVPILEVYSKQEEAEKAYRKYVEQIYNTMKENTFLDTSWVTSMPLEEMFEYNEYDETDDNLSEGQIVWDAGEYLLGGYYFVMRIVNTSDDIDLPIMPFVDVKSVGIKDVEKDKQDQPKVEPSKVEEPKIDVSQIIVQANKNRAMGVCQYCGGKFKGLFKKTCSQCGRVKDYK